MPVNPTQINNTISTTISPNGVGAITAVVLAGVLINIVAWVNAGFQPLLSASPVSCAASTCSVPVAQMQTALGGAAAQTITLPSSASWATNYGGIAYAPPLVIYDGALNAGTYARTILPAGSDTIDGYTSGQGGVGLYANGASLGLQAIAGGWKIQ